MFSTVSSLKQSYRYLEGTPDFMQVYCAFPAAHSVSLVRANCFAMLERTFMKMILPKKVFDSKENGELLENVFAEERELKLLA
jgi:hypothetical protein